MKKIALSLLVIAASGAYVWDQRGRGPGDDLLRISPAAGGAETSSIKPRALGGTAPEPTYAPRRGPVAIDKPISAQGAGEPSGLTAFAAAEPARPQGAPSQSSQSRVSVPAFSPPQSPPAATTAPAQAVSTTAAAAVDATMPGRPSEYAELRLTRVAATAAGGHAATVTVRGYADGTYTGPIVDAYYGLVQIQAIVQGGRLVGIKVLQYPSDRRTSIMINRQALPMLRDEVVAAQSPDVDIISGATLTSEAFVRSLKGALHKSLM